MRLEIQAFNVHHIAFGRITRFSDGLLQVCKEELVNLISKDKRFQNVDIEIVRTGERARITNILDILEPRIKADDSEGYYPGILPPLFRAGSGKSNVLKGCAVLEIGYKPGFYGGIVDMTGVGARLTPHSKTHNLCILTTPSPDLDLMEYGLALKRAGAKASVYLAESTRNQQPDETRIFDLEIPSVGTGTLPKVGYLYQLHSHGDCREPFIYGGNARHYYPTVLHPNEILDGAIVCGHYNQIVGLKNTTYSILNHPVILDLFDRHGKDLDFKGVVIVPEPNTMDEIQRTAMMAAGLLKEVLGVKGAIITKEGGGHTDVDIMSNCDACERFGIKTVLLDNEWLGPDGTGDVSLLAMSDRADAIVSVGNTDEIIEMPPVERVVGGDIMPDIEGDLRGSVRVPICSIPNVISQLGLNPMKIEIW